MLSRVVFKKQRGRRPVTALAILSLATGMIVSSGTVLAVHDETFQLDGDVLASTPTSIGTPGQTVDWDSIFTGISAATGEGTPAANLPTGFTDPGFKQDFGHTTATDGTFITSDTTTYATGSKDTLPISGWQCNFDNNVNSKIDVMNAYAVSYTVPAGEVGAGDEIMYFGLERNTNTGDANVGFWFLQSAASCTSTGGSVDWDGAHADGDVLVVSEFSGGGDVSTINAYRWNGDDATGSLGTTSIAVGADCRATTQVLNDPICGAANRADITTPWLTANFKDKVGHALRTAEFFEGGINLTDSGLGGQCFNTFIADTRSSTSLTATLFDYASSTLGGCTSTTVTTPSIPWVGSPPAIGSQAIPGDPADASISVTDSALVTVGGVTTFSGSVSWHLCGPTATTSTALCTSGGVAVGAAKAVTTSPSTVVSDAAIVTSAGRYCWRADFSGDLNAGVPASSDSSATECFVITPLQPTLVTQATTGPVDFGQKISDTVTLANTAHKPGTGGTTVASINPTTLGGDATGDITLTAYGPDSCTTVAYGPVSIAASGNGDTGGVGTTFEFTPGAPGLYVFVASYAGDLPNTLGVTATACGSQPTAEQVLVRQIPTQIATTPSYFPQDSATVTSSLAGNNLPANGTVTFSLYGATAGPVSALTNCQAAGSTGLVYGPIAISTGVAAHSVTVGTDNTTFRVSATGTYYWLVTYAPGDTAHTGIQSNCVENINAILTGDAGPGTLFPTPVTP